MGDAKLYVIPASHSSRGAMLMLDRKGIPYKRVDLMPVISKGVLRAQRFPGVTVPALKIDGRRIQGPEKSRASSIGSVPSHRCSPAIRSGG